MAPDGDLFRAIGKGTVSMVTDHIDTFTETGIRTRGGEELDADIVVTATGLELLFIGGIEVSVDGEPVDLPSKMTYKGMMLEGVPNLALAIGYTNASWTLKCDLTCEHVTRLLNHLHETGLRQCTPINRSTKISSEPLLGLTASYMQRSAAKFPKQGECRSLAGPPELPARLPRPASQRDRGRRHGVHQPRTHHRGVRATARGRRLRSRS